MSRDKQIIMPQLQDCGGDMNPNKKWHIFYSYRNEATGKMERFRDGKGFGKLKTPAERYAFAKSKITELSDKLLNGWNPFLGKEVVVYKDELLRFNQVKVNKHITKINTFSYYSSQWLKEKSKTVEHSSIITYRSKLRRFREWLCEMSIHDLVGNLTTEVIIQFFEYLVNELNLSHESIKNYKQLLTIIFDLAVDDGVIGQNPVDPSIKGGHRNDCGAQPIAPADLTKLKDALAKDHQLNLAAMLQFYCFMRPSREVRIMKVSWIHWGSEMIIVPEDACKTKRAKHLTIPKPLMTVLKDMNIHLAEPTHYVLGKGGKPGPECWGKNHFSEKFRRLRIKLNLPTGYKFYSFKHTGNQVAEAAGIPLSVIMNQNGHSNLNTTTKYLKKSAKVADHHIQDLFPEMGTT